MPVVKLEPALRAISASAVLLFSVGGLAAQTSSPFECAANAAVPPAVRAEGVTELAGDLVLNCTGGVPTPAGAPVPQVNIQVFLNTNVTSRLLSSPMSEALLLIGEPKELDQRTCTPGPCPINGTGTLGGVNYAAPSPSTVPNVFQGRQTGVNAVTFFGVPVDPPGPGGVRVIRITNVRSNAAQLGVALTLIPARVQMYVSVSGSSSIPVSNPQQTVAYVTRGLEFGVHRIDANENLVAVNDPDGVRLTPCGSYQRIALKFEEGFGSAFLVRGTPPAGAVYSPDVSPAPAVQASPGVDRFTETGFYNPAFPSTNGLNRAGLADHGTRLMARFTNIPSGATLTADLYNRNGFPRRARMVFTDANGGGAFSAAASEMSYLPIVDGTATAVWEVMWADPFALESLEFVVAISYSSTTANGTAQVTGGFAPLSLLPISSDTASIPRFMTGTTRGAYTIYPSYYSLLYPFVSNSPGFDTQLVISNTTYDPFTNYPRSGTCTLYFYGPNAPPPQTSQSIPGGGQLVWTLAAGGNYGIAATPGFQGYIIAKCTFPYVHGYAFFVGGPAPPATGRAGYQALVLDAPFTTLETSRTLIYGEEKAH